MTSDYECVCSHWLSEHAPGGGGCVDLACDCEAFVYVESPTGKLVRQGYSLADAMAITHDPPPIRPHPNYLSSNPPAADLEAWREEYERHLTGYAAPIRPPSTAPGPILSEEATCRDPFPARPQTRRRRRTPADAPEGQPYRWERVSAIPSPTSASQPPLFPESEAP